MELNNNDVGIGHEEFARETHKDEHIKAFYRLTKIIYKL